MSKQDMKLFYYQLSIKYMELRLNTLRDNDLWYFYYDQQKYYFDKFLKESGNV